MAAEKKGWMPVDKGEGNIIATLDLRSHQAVVDIKFTRDYYSITYVSSKNLEYDGTNIHKNYNNWVIRLNREINKNLIKEIEHQ